MYLFLAGVSLVCGVCAFGLHLFGSASNESMRFVWSIAAFLMTLSLCGLVIRGLLTVWRLPFEPYMGSFNMKRELKVLSAEVPASPAAALSQPERMAVLQKLAWRRRMVMTLIASVFLCELYASGPWIVKQLDERYPNPPAQANAPSIPLYTPFPLFEATDPMILPENPVYPRMLVLAMVPCMLVILPSDQFGCFLPVSQ